MKVIVGEKAYVWKFDLTFMEREFSFLPSTFYMRFVERYPIHFTFGPNDAVSFGYVFEEKDAVDFLKECDYIYDFLEYRKLDIKELKETMNKNLEDFNAVVEFYGQQNDAYKVEHRENMNQYYEKTYLMNEQLRVLIKCKKGSIKMPELPDGVIDDCDNAAERGGDDDNKPSKKKFRFLKFLGRRNRD